MLVHGGGTRINISQAQSKNKNTINPFTAFRGVRIVPG